jgi:hypothetical protein
MIKAATMVTISLVLWGMSVDSAAPDPTPGTNGGCASDVGYRACDGRSQITVEVQRTKTGQRQSRSGTASLVERPGTIRLVACGAGTTSQLQTLGDPSAAFDARGCVSGQPGCDQTSQDTGRPYRNYVRVVKQADGTWSLTGTECDAIAAAAPPRVTPVIVWEQARRLISAAPIGLAPRESTLVNIQTIMWVDTAAARMVPSVVLLGQPVSIHIAIDHVGWAFGDGRADIGEGPGKPYDPQVDSCPTKQCPGYFGHVYTTTGQMTITATVTWRASFRVGGGVFTPIPGTIPGPSASAGILVREARSVLVPDPTPT